MGTFGDRIKHIRKQIANMSQDIFAKEVGVKSKQTISDVENSKQKSLPQDVNKKIIERFNINPQWLYYGDGEPTTTATKSNNTINIPILSIAASAGFGNNIESVDIFKSGDSLAVAKSLFKLPPNVNKLYAIKVDGESMVPRLLPDSWVIFEEQNSWSGDGLYVINYNNVLMVKLIEVNPKNGNLYIKSVNPQYSSWEYNPKEDNSNFKIVGKVLRSIV